MIAEGERRQQEDGRERDGNGLGRRDSDYDR